jgi:hypothetical protein
MMSQTLETAEPPEKFPPEVCPVCGYSLQGLPGEGICPECGNAYDSSQLILYGWACGRHATPYNSRGRRLIFTLLPIWFLWQIFQPFADWRLRIGMAGFWVLSILIVLVRRRPVDHPGGIQLRMDQNGIAQIDDLEKLRHKPQIAPKRFVSWNEVDVETWKTHAPDKLRLRLQLRYPWYKPIGEPYPVDAEVRCTAEEATKLRLRIQRWRER